MLNKKSAHLGFILDSQGILYKTVKDQYKILDALVVPKFLQKYILHESQLGHSHNGSTRQYQFFKRQ